jgi:hypothetical protein
MPEILLVYEALTANRAHVGLPLENFLLRFFAELEVPLFGHNSRPPLPAT